jgi:hypothetical protein
MSFIKSFRKLPLFSVTFTKTPIASSSADAILKLKEEAVGRNMWNVVLGRGDRSDKKTRKKT